jgi:hypothetical protein
MPQTCLFVENRRHCKTAAQTHSFPHLLGTQSAVNNAGVRGLPGVFGRWKYSRLQGSCPERVKTLQNRAPVEAGRAA